MPRQEPAAAGPQAWQTVRLSDVATPLAQIVTTSLDEPVQVLGALRTNRGTGAGR